MDTPADKSLWVDKACHLNWSVRLWSDRIGRWLESIAECAANFSLEKKTWSWPWKYNLCWLVNRSIFRRLLSLHVHAADKLAMAVTLWEPPNAEKREISRLDPRNYNNKHKDDSIRYPILLWECANAVIRVDTEYISNPVCCSDLAYSKSRPAFGIASNWSESRFCCSVRRITSSRSCLLKGRFFCLAAVILLYVSIILRKKIQIRY